MCVYVRLSPEFLVIWWKKNLFYIIKAANMDLLCSLESRLISDIRINIFHFTRSFLASDIFRYLCIELATFFSLFFLFTVLSFHFISFFLLVAWIEKKRAFSHQPRERERERDKAKKICLWAMWPLSHLISDHTQYLYESFILEMLYTLSPFAIIHVSHTPNSAWHLIPLY